MARSERITSFKWQIHYEGHLLEENRAEEIEKNRIFSYDKSMNNAGCMINVLKKFQCPRHVLGNPH